MGNISQQAQQAISPKKDAFREIPVKVHVRRPDRDAWSYIGRGMVVQEAFGQGSRIGVFPLVLHHAMPQY